MVPSPVCSDLSQVGGNRNSKGSENLDIFICVHVLRVCAHVCMCMCVCEQNIELPKGLPQTQLGLLPSAWA